MAQFEESIRGKLLGNIGYYEELIEKCLERFREDSLVCTGIVKDQHNVRRMLRRNLRKIDAQRKRNYSSDLKKTFNQSKAAIRRSLSQVWRMMKVVRRYQLDVKSAKERGEVVGKKLSMLSGRCQNAMTVAELKVIRNELQSVDSWIAYATLVETSILHVENLWSEMTATADWDKEIQKLDARLTKI